MNAMNFNNPYGESTNHHILSVLVQNRPGVLARVASLFARRGYNIFSLAVAPTENIPVKIGILNNSYLGMVRQWQEMFYGERYS